MKALLVHPGPEFSVADVYRGWLGGLRDVGVQVAEYNLHDRLAFYAAAHLERDGEFIHAFDWPAACVLATKGLSAACYEFEPDVVVVVSGFFVDEALIATIRRHGTKVALIHTESPYEDDRQAERAQWVDANVLNDPTNIDRFPPGSVYLPHCYDPEIHRPQPATRGFESEFCFVGTGYPSRVGFFEQVDWSGIDATLAGNWVNLNDSSPLKPLLLSDSDCLDNREAAALYTSTLTSANLYRREANDGESDDGWAMGPREVELAACGTWFARDPRGESDLVLPMLPTFTDPAELGDVLRWALAHPEQREAAATKARAAVADRTFDRNAAELLHLLGV